MLWPADFDLQRQAEATTGVTGGGWWTSKKVGFADFWQGKRWGFVGIFGDFWGFLRDFEGLKMTLSSKKDEQLKDKVKLRSFDM